MRTLLDARQRAAVMRRILAVRPETPRRWGKMTAHQMVVHLTDAFLTSLGDRPARERSTPFRRTIVRFVAFTLPIRWPHGFAAPPEVRAERGGTPPEIFEEDLHRLADSAEAFVRRLDPTTMRHPLFGPLRAAEWGRFGWRHVDHHARQFGL
jgi:hypothetical protein